MTRSKDSGALASHVLSFVRLLRRAGLPIGPGKALIAVEALSAIDITKRDDVFWSLHAVCVARHSQSDLFTLAFEKFWDRSLGESSTPFMFDDALERSQASVAEVLPRRLAEAMVDTELAKQMQKEPSESVPETELMWSAVERLTSKDFESMSSDEIVATRKAMADMRLPIPTTPTRRFRPHAAGRRIDMRLTLRDTVRAGGAIDLKRKAVTQRRPPLVLLCDISGSMESYARMLLHFMHAVTNDRDRVHTFLFGTRLTNVTHHLAHADPDIALSKVGYAVTDWSGGTRIGQTLSTFNRKWSRRVLGQGAVVILITDGLDRDGGEGLALEVERLQKSCRRLIWLNPLLRYDEFEPKSAGIKAILPYVDDFRPVHNLDSLTQLADVLSEGYPIRGASNQATRARHE